LSCQIVNNGREAVEAVKSNHYSLLLMDCQMPKMDGFAATAEIRKAEALSGFHIPIIAMTANAMLGDRERCLAAGMDDYVSKPIDPQQLRLVLENWLPSMRNGSSSRTHSETIIINQTDEDAQLVNMDKLEGRLGKANARKLLSTFIETGASNVLSLKSAIASHDAKQLRDSAHAFKGVCGTLCLEQLESVCVRIEKIAHACDWEQAETLERELDHLFEATRMVVDTAKEDA